MTDYSRRAVLDRLACIWSESDSLRLAYRLDRFDSPLVAALNAWAVLDDYNHHCSSAQAVLDVVDALAGTVGPTCYPELFDDLRDYGAASAP